jgi:hypothetical protein
MTKLTKGKYSVFVNRYISYTHMRPVQKVSNLGPGKQSSVSGWLQYLIPFKVGSMRFHTLSPAVLPSLETLLKGLFFNDVQLYCHVLYDVLAAVKTGAFLWCSISGAAINHKEPCKESREPDEPVECHAWPGNPGSGVMNELGHCHDAAASCVRPTAPV